MNIAARPATTFVPFDALQAELRPAPSPLRSAITAACLRDEPAAVAWLLDQAAMLDARPGLEVEELAGRLVANVRTQRSRASGVDALMHEFSLSSEEGVALMCLAEALLRIPDAATADRLIADKISKGDWKKHLGESPSLFVNAATWGLLVTGKLVSPHSETGLGAALTRLIARSGEGLIRKGVDVAMRMLGKQFVTGRTIDEALKNGRDNEARGYRYSYDMLGEAALTAADAERYLAAYETAIHAIGKAAQGRGIQDGPGISIKLSALHPRYSRGQQGRVMAELLPRVRALMLLAKGYGIGINIDAEEADRLELSLDLLEALAFDPALDGFDGIGLVVQAYQKRCPFVIDWLVDLAHRSGRRFMVRLVKGAYWDSEIKRAQVAGLPGYPVYTRKVYTDLSYLVCARRLLAASDVLYPQFATHNAHSLAAIYTWAQHAGISRYEFQCLHGMGETLYDQVVGPDRLDRPCRIYAPVGSHETLLAYLVRRLLENGANTSFVNQIVDADIPIAALLADPFATARALGGQAHPHIPLPVALYPDGRRNAAGLDLADERTLAGLARGLHTPRHYQAGPLLAAPIVMPGETIAIVNPAQHADVVGHVRHATRADVDTALDAAVAAAPAWEGRSGQERATILERVADLFERQHEELMALAVREAGKSVPNALAEVREAVDFLRYYAAGIRDIDGGRALGPVVCISPWNFPLAIFTGQIAAALAAGNTVLAKPAEQTPLIAWRAVTLFHEAGVPAGALQLLPGTGEAVGASLCLDTRTRGVVFTGSTDVALSINRTLAERAVREGADIPLIAETGGQNAMIVDSSALPEQVVQDVLASAFDSAGQRCSALRVLFLQEEVADKIIAMLDGAMAELQIGVPDRLATDIGPVIDAEARDRLLAHVERMRPLARRCRSLPLADALAAQGSFVAPTLLEIDDIGQLRHEVFGPVLHVVRFRRDELGQVVDAINATGYGLTLGVHSRIDDTVAFVAERAHVGNLYVNRNIVGAVVGVQPFGGEGQSGTGPKAGGPLYLHRLRRATDPVLTRIPGAPTPAALLSLRAWAVEHDHASLVPLFDAYAAGSPHGVTLALPGPTGECNQLRFVGRGNVLCAAASPAGLLNQLAAVLATGNHALLADDASTRLVHDLPQAVRDHVTFVGTAALDDAPLALALLDTGTAAAWRPRLAARDGAIVGIVPTDGAATIPLWRLVLERAVCVNTTAAGGNASLMTLRE
jgi:RHH-type proline utilization regulon transcriptional repressor/proline dehydrogenase/delta 1-pyrroline-5-carboxylate dehydrogenase